MRRFLLFASIMLLFASNASLLWATESTKPATKPATQDNDNNASTPSPSQAGTAAPTTATGPLSDYVPCIFMEGDQYSMRAQPSPQKPEKPLDKAAAEMLFEAADTVVNNALNSFRPTDEFKKAFDDFYSNNLRSDSLVGMTREQAIAKIQYVVRKATEDARIRAPEAVRKLSDEEIGERKKDAAQTLSDAVSQKVLPLLKTQDTPTVIKEGRNVIEAAALDHDYKTNVLGEYDNFTKPLQKGFYLPQLTAAVENAASLAHYPPAPVKADPDQINRELADLNETISTGTTKAARTAPDKPFQPPNDVSCSMAVMGWKETSDIFGRRVANTFVAIQVTLRNLNTKNEFLVHDIQVAVDTGVPLDYFGRFQAGRDKLLVRAVAQRGQSSDRRNIAVNVLQAVGSIGAATSLVAGTVEFKDAFAVFQGAFIPGFANIFPDHTVEQLNHINDLVFSASNTNKVVVPVQGSVPLVTFISEKPLEQLPFAWCGHPASGKLKRWFGHGTEQNCNFNGGSQQSGYVTPYRYTKGGKQLPANPDESSYHQGPVIPPTLDRNGEVQPVVDDLPAWDNLKYKDWRAAAVRMLQEHTFVVVGGIHIQEVVTQPKVTNLDCPTLSTGQIDASQTKDGMVTCSVMGSGLNLVSAVTLQKGDSKIAGKIKSATDGNSATLTFKPEDVCGSEGTYSLSLTYKSGAQNPTDLDSGESASLAKQPTVSSVSFSNDTLTLNGACLDQLDTVSLAPQVTGDAAVKGGAVTPGTDGKNTTATSVFALQTGKDKTGLKPGANYYLTYTTKVQPAVAVKNETLTVKVPQSAGTAETTSGASGNKPQPKKTAAQTPSTDNAIPVNPPAESTPGSSAKKPLPRNPTTATQTPGSNRAKQDQH